jgi:hypothetical protein
MSSPQIVPVEAEFTLLKRHLSEMKRRSAVRYRCNLATYGRVLFPDGGETLDTWVHNLSETGIGINLSRSLSVGTALVVRLKGPSEGVTIKLGARVVHATQEVDGTWRVGCEFETRLSHEELDALL